MQKAETVLAVIRQRGKEGKPLERVYRHLFNRDLYLLAYGRIYRNKGAMTPGATDETVDGMSLEKIDAIIEALRYERYQWTPVQRTYIPKKNGKQRPLGKPSWSDKLVQEVLRLILDAYYEPQFSNHSHGFRPERACHTALREVYYNWRGTTWFIEGDIAQCFDSFDHQILLDLLSEKIHDGRFITLIKRHLEAGYMEKWKWNATLSGTPQGSILSPILANIYLDKLDKWMENHLIPKNHRGDKRQENPRYKRLQQKSRKLEQKGQYKAAKPMRQQMRRIPSKLPNDTTFRRLRYVRYADDFLLGYAGTKAEAEEIVEEIRHYMSDTLKLELSKTKTLVTHARSEKARFLGYHIHMVQNDTKRSASGRRVNGIVGLEVPTDVIQDKRRKYIKNDKPIHRAELMNNSVYDIIIQYQLEYRGLVNFYRMAANLYQLDKLKYVMEASLTKTLARKLRITVSQVYKRFGSILKTSNGPYKGLQYLVEREGKQPLVAQWGGISLKRDLGASLEDAPVRIYPYSRSELEQRLLAQTCELCGSTEKIQVHHIRALRDLNRPGQKAKPAWMQAMIARNRKTLVLCHDCHMDIEYGRPQGQYKTK